MAHLDYIFSLFLTSRFPYFQLDIYVQRHCKMWMKSKDDIQYGLMYFILKFILRAHATRLCPVFCDPRSLKDILYTQRFFLEHEENQWLLSVAKFSKRLLCAASDFQSSSLSNITNFESLSRWTLRICTSAELISVSEKLNWLSHNKIWLHMISTHMIIIRRNWN